MDYLSFKSALYLLLESKKELKSLLDRGKVTQEQYDDILNSLPKKLDKYAGWIGRNINNTEASINHIIDLLHWFENNKNKLDEKDINKYTVDSLQSTFDKIGVSKSQQQKEIKGDGAKLIAETDEYLLYEIYTYEASCYYGSGTKWCITGNNLNNPYGSGYSWEKNTKRGAKFMFLIKKNGDIDDVYYKVVIAYKDYEGKRYVLAAFDALDVQINLNNIKYITKSVDNNWDYTYFKSDMWFGDVPIDIMSTEDILNKILVVESYTIKSDGTVDVNGNVNMDNMNLNKIPVKFGKVTGDFYCSNNKLTSLKGAPQSVGGDFRCNLNKLTSLVDSPQSVGGNFYCRENKLTTLDGSPESVGKDFSCSINKLTSLKGGPQSVGGGFYCDYNELVSLEDTPEIIKGDFDCSSNKLTSLDGAPQSVSGDFNCSNNKVKFTENDVYAVSDVKGNIIV
jgi:hypothetical protein